MGQADLSPEWSGAQAFVILSLGTCRLLLPQSEMRLLESVLDVQISEPPVNGLGWLPFDGSQWPVYGLDAKLNPLLVLPPTYRICALVSHADGYFGLVCTDVVTVAAETLDVRPLPVPMVRPQSPVRGVALQGDQVVLASRSEALAEFLGVVGALIHAH